MIMPCGLYRERSGSQTDVSQEPYNGMLVGQVHTFTCLPQRCIARLAGHTFPVVVEQPVSNVVMPQLVQAGITSITLVAAHLHFQIDVPAQVEERATGVELVDHETGIIFATGIFFKASSRILEQKNGSGALIVWFTGLSGAGKSTISSQVHDHLSKRGYSVCLLDSDYIRRYLSPDLGFTPTEREANVKRLAALAFAIASQTDIVLVSSMSPCRRTRESIRHCWNRFIEVYVEAPVSICAQRDVKGLYKKALLREIHDFTGLDLAYDPPLAPEVECHTEQETQSESVLKVLQAIEKCRYSWPITSVNPLCEK